MLDALTRRVRVLSIAQLARTWWADAVAPTRGARQRARVLEELGYVETFRAPSHPEIDIKQPVLTWQPGEAVPDFSTASYRLKRRWSAAPLLMTFVIASTRAGRTFGVHGGRRPREVELTHDLHLAAVYLRLLRTDPDAARRWVFEEALRSRRDRPDERLPDAQIEGENARIVEFGGSYGKRKLADFHSYCEGRGSAYEIW